jgi:hypothetical protein
MIIVWTEYDEATEVLAECAEQLVAEAGSRVANAMKPANAVRLDIEAALTSNKTDMVFLFGHGTPNPGEYLGNDGTPALDRASVALLAGRVVCGTFCSSVDGLGEHAAGARARFLGYRGELWVPFEAPYSSTFLDCGLAGPRALVGGASVESARGASESAYRKAARVLLNRRDVRDRVHGVFMELNADAVDAVP